MVHECETCGSEMDKCDKCPAVLCPECYEENDGLCSVCGETCPDCDELVTECSCEEEFEDYCDYCNELEADCKCDGSCPCPDCQQKEGHKEQL